jgi:tetratricopeptide (TPR) repeat protein
MRNEARTAILVLGIFLAAGAAFIYGRVFGEDNPGDYQVRKGNYRLEDGLFEDAIREFEAAMAVNPEHPGAHLGLAITFLQMGRLEEAIARFDQSLSLDPGMAAAYANRGIAWDRSGEHEKALNDYRTALELDARLVKGPGWLWRFLRNVDEKPPTIEDRADYLEAELAKPEAERLLQVPEKDADQRMYKVK